MRFGWGSLEIREVESNGNIVNKAVVKDWKIGFPKDGEGDGKGENLKIKDFLILYKLRISYFPLKSLGLS